MIPGLFPRLFGSFKEGGLIHVKFAFTTAGASPVIVYRNPGGVFAVANTTSQPAIPRSGQVTLARAGGVGLYTLTLTGGARSMVLENAKYLNKAGAVANDLRIEAITQVETTGLFNLHFVNSAGALADTQTANDEVHITLYVDK